MASTLPESSDIRAHLAMMQSVITRMAENSRACKTWAVTLVAAILVVAARFGDAPFDPEAALIALVPTALFWVLDSYYLALERAFRESYNGFVSRFHEDALNEGEVFKVSPSGSVPRHFWESQRSIAIWPFYLAVVILIVVFWLVLS